jgi:hypothetical protein
MLVQLALASVALRPTIRNVLVPTTVNSMYPLAPTDCREKAFPFQLPPPLVLVRLLPVMLWRTLELASTQRTSATASLHALAAGVVEMDTSAHCAWEILGLATRPRASRAATAWWRMAFQGGLAPGRTGAPAPITSEACAPSIGLQAAWP